MPRIHLFLPCEPSSKSPRIRALDALERLLPEDDLVDLSERCIVPL
jgi:hypothetical protein